MVWPAARIGVALLVVGLVVMALVHPLVGFGVLLGALAVDLSALMLLVVDSKWARTTGTCASP